MNLLNNNKNIVLIIVFLLVIYYIKIYYDYNKYTLTILDFGKLHKSGDFKIFEIDNLLTKEDCDNLIKLSTDLGLKKSGSGFNNNFDNNHRLSDQIWLNKDYNNITEKISKYSEIFTNIPSNKQEALQIVRYKPGGKFNSHYDAYFFDKREQGIRRTTLLIYLNDDFTGGETSFPLLNIKIKPEIGKGLLFWNTSENNNILFKSLHKGHVVSSGDKWIVTVWSLNKECN